MNNRWAGHLHAKALRGRRFRAITFRTEKPLDNTDWQILRELQADGRLSYHELGRRIGLSSPAIAERVRRLEDAGVIAGYQARVDPVRAGLPIAAFIQMRCRLDQCLLRTSESNDYPEVVEIHKLSGDHCAMLKVRASSMEHLEGLFERLGKHGEMRTSIVLSTQFADRPVDAPIQTFAGPTSSSGWSQAQRSARKEPPTRRRT